MRFTSWHIPPLTTEMVRSLTEAKLVETDSPTRVASALARELHAYVEEQEAAPLGARFGAVGFALMLDELIAVLSESTWVGEVFGEDVELRRCMEEAFTTVLIGVVPAASPSAEEPPEAVGSLRYVDQQPMVVFDDGMQLPVTYELLDACHAQPTDRVRARRANESVTHLAPLLSTPEALLTLSRAGVLDASTDLVGPWPEVLFEVAWGLRGESPSVVAHDHDEFSSEAVDAWLRRSGMDKSIVVDGPPDAFDGSPTVVIDIGQGPRKPVRCAAHDLGAEINRILTESNAVWRWYALPSIDSRAAFLRLDRDTATELGVGVFSTP